MSSESSRTYRTGEFARLAGVTPRTLRHYDRLGLLKPRRTAAGYRVYADRDLERLVQVVALKFIGIPLKKIGRLAATTRAHLTEALRAQCQVLEERGDCWTSSSGQFARQKLRSETTAKQPRPCTVESLR